MQLFAAPDRVDQAQRILAIPVKCTRARPIDYLDYEEHSTVLAGIDRTTETVVGTMHYWCSCLILALEPRRL
jgi:hypothetical protein